ncbi:MAG: hypothetical protein MZW92_79430 [Comamonadaceae bacterium]|nr:hypothetical protein [Comamonadaceae bacterium]
MKHGRPRQAGDELSRRAALLARQGRSLPLRVPEDRRACWPRRSASSPASTASPSSRASAAPSGCKPYTEPDAGGARPRRRRRASTWSARASPPTAWRRWRRSRMEVHGRVPRGGRQGVPLHPGAQRTIRNGSPPSAAWWPTISAAG